MKKIQVYGPGCANCQKLYELTSKTVKELEADFTIEKIEDINSMVSAGVMRTPALGFDGEIVTQGKLPSESTLKNWILERINR